MVRRGRWALIGAALLLGAGGLAALVASGELRAQPGERTARSAAGTARAPAPHGETRESMSDEREVATLAGGCFWGVEELLRQLPGVIETTVGYTGGELEAPRYEQVSSGQTGHAEAVRVLFDPGRVSYEAILDYFFRLHDPTTQHRQGNDVGTQYRSVIFYHDDEQRRVAEGVKQRVDRSRKWKSKVVTEIVPAKPFYPAEDYHQSYLQKHPRGYTCHYLRD